MIGSRKSCCESELKETEGNQTKDNAELNNATFLYYEVQQRLIPVVVAGMPIAEIRISRTR